MLKRSHGEPRQELVQFNHLQNEPLNFLLIFTGPCKVLSESNVFIYLVQMIRNCIEMRNPKLHYHSKTVVTTTCLEAN